jgi:hypothetical protein
MTQPGYQEGSERAWWWKVAMHLDSAQLASVNAMTHNLDDQASAFALQDKLREAQAILLEIFRSKGLLPVAPPAGVQPPPPQQPQPQPPPFAFAGAPPQPPFAGPQPPAATNGAVDVRASDFPPTAATVPPPMIVTDDVPLGPATEPVPTPAVSETET